MNNVVILKFPDKNMSTPQKTIKFNFSRINTKQFAVFEDIRPDPENIQLNAEMAFGIDPPKKIIGATAKFKFSSKESPFLMVEVECQFSILDESWNDLTKESGELHLPINFARHISMLTIGTARGVLHAKTEDSEYNKFFLPPIDLSNLVPNEVVFKTED